MAMDWPTLTATKATAQSIRRWTNSDKIDPEEVIADAEDWLAQRFRVRRMWTRTTLPLAAGASSIALATALPSFLDPVSVRLQGYGRLRFIVEDEIDDHRAEDADGTLSETIPSAFTIIGTDMLFDVEADDDYTVMLIYFARPAALSVSNTTNLYTTNYRALFKAVCMGFSYVFLKDEPRAQQLFASASDHMAQAMANDDLIRRGQEYTVRVND